LKWLWAKFADPLKGLLRRDDRFSRGVITIMSGTILSRIIVFATIPFLTRLFTPSDFGVLAIFGLIVGSMGTLITGRYEAAIVLPESDEEAVNILGVCIGLATINSALLFVIFYYCTEAVAIFFGAPELIPWLYWAPLCSWAIGIFTALRRWNSRTDDFKWISIANVGDVGALAITQIGVGLLFRGVLTGLMLGPFAGRLTGAAILLLRALKSDGPLIRRSLNFRVAVDQAKRYLRFPLYDLPASMLGTLSREMPTGILGIFFVTQWVGLYSIANRILSVPLQVLGGSIAQVYLPVALDAKRSGRLDSFTLTIFDRLLSISFTPMLVVAIGAPELISTLLGERWLMAGEILQYLMPSLLMVFIASPLSEVFSVLERQQEKLVFNIALFITRLISLVVGGMLGDPILAIIMYSASGTIFWMLQCFWILRLSQITSQTITAHIMAEILHALPFIIFAIGVENYYEGSPRRISLAICITIVTFIAFRWKEFLGPGMLKKS
jgi:O-antigen/teichoic acid export membrane protein